MRIAVGAPECKNRAMNCMAPIVLRVSPRAGWSFLARGGMGLFLQAWLVSAAGAGEDASSSGAYGIDRMIDPDARAIVADTALVLDIPKNLALATAYAESRFDVKARSRKGAVGLMQVMPATAREVVKEMRLGRRDLHNTADNVLIGGLYLKKMLLRYGDIHLALAAYNAGPGQTDRWVAKGGGLCGRDVVRRFGFPETVAYVAEVVSRIRYLETAGGGDEAGEGRDGRIAWTARDGETLLDICLREKISLGRTAAMNGCGEWGVAAEGRILWLRPLTAKPDGTVMDLRTAASGEVEARVFKAERRLELRGGGVTLREYPIGIGADSEADKLEPGDGRTPEGSFRVSGRLLHEFYGPCLAMESADEARAWRLLMEGRIEYPEYSRVLDGESIHGAGADRDRVAGVFCIHGGGSGCDWTAGCISMDEADMRELFAILPRGGRVTVFGGRQAQ